MEKFPTQLPDNQTPETPGDFHEPAPAPRKVERREATGEHRNILQMLGFDALTDAVHQGHGKDGEKVEVPTEAQLAHAEYLNHLTAELDQPATHESPAVEVQRPAVPETYPETNPAELEKQALEAAEKQQAAPATGGDAGVAGQAVSPARQIAAADIPPPPLSPSAVREEAARLAQERRKKSMLLAGTAGLAAVIGLIGLLTSL